MAVAFPSPLLTPAARLAPARRPWLLAGIVVLHAAAGWALLQLHLAPDRAAPPEPLFVSLIERSTPPPLQPVPLSLPTPPQAALVLPTITIPVIAAVESQPAAMPSVPAAAVSAFEAAVTLPTPPAPVAPATPPAETPSPPKRLPPAAVQYLVPPVLVYPRLSERNGERGRVLVRVFIDTAGLPQDVQVAESSGFPRLDEAALAAVRKARFKPYLENGQPTAGWAIVPAAFE